MVSISDKNTSLQVQGEGGGRERVEGGRREGEGGGRRGWREGEGGRRERVEGGRGWREGEGEGRERVERAREKAGNHHTIYSNIPIKYYPKVLTGSESSITLHTLQ